jgi:hypothetical protein
MFGWFKSERRKRRKKVRQDRKHLEERTRRFLKAYLDADQTRKPQFYRAVEDISKKCQPAELGLSQSDVEDSQIAEATSQAAMQMVLDHASTHDKDFFTDACATVAVAYHRAAGVYAADEKDESVRNCRCSPSNDGNVLHQRTERMISEMTGDQSRTLKVGDRVCWKTSATDLGTIVGTAWNGVSIDWDDGQSTSIQHNDMGQVERGKMKAR